MLDPRAWLKKVAACLCLAGLGCVGTDKPLTYFGDAELQYYTDTATQVAFPDVVSESPDDTLASGPPHMISESSLNGDSVKDLSLDDAFRLAMQNNRILKTVGQFDSQYASGLLSNPRGLQSVYDIGIQESTVGADPSGTRGRRGVEDALSDFDTTLTNQLLLGNSEQVQNNRFASGGLPPGSTLLDETANFQATLQKRYAYGGQISLTHNVARSFNNRPNQLFDTSFTGQVQAGYRQPLWAGAGADFTRIAGPKAFDALNISPGSTMSFDRGVVIARIDSDMALGDFQTAVRDQIRDVENVYWDLYRAYRIYDDEIVSRQSALRNYRKVLAMHQRNIIGIEGLEQAKSSYFDAKSRVENALADIFANETRLRRMCGLKVSDGHILRPSSEPMIAEFKPQWELALADALSRRVELRTQKWEIKRAELQLRAANNMRAPSLDFVMNYSVNGFGRELFDNNDNDGNFSNNGAATQQGLRSFYESITQGNQTGWNIGFELGIPLGMRSINAQIRNLELRLAKQKGILVDQEREVSHELARSFQELSRQYRLVKTNYNRWLSARQYRDTVEDTQDLPGNRGRTPEAIDRLLRAEQTLTDARRQFHVSIVDYNKAISDIHYRKGTLLTSNKIHMAEGLWDPQAYKEALRRAWARSHATHKRDHMVTEPPEFISAYGPSASFVAPQTDGELLPPEPNAPVPTPAPEGQPQEDTNGPLATSPDAELRSAAFQLDDGSARFGNQRGVQPAGYTGVTGGRVDSVVPSLDQSSSPQRLDWSDVSENMKSLSESKDDGITADQLDQIIFQDKSTP